MATYRIGRNFDSGTTVNTMEEVLAKAKTLGDPFTVWSLSNRHWSIVLDRSIKGHTASQIGYGAVIPETLKSALARFQGK